MFEFPSITIPLSFLLILYGAFMVFFVIYSFFNVYHLVRYGLNNISLRALVLIFLSGTFILLLLSALQMMQYDWSGAVNLNKASSSLNTNLFGGL